MREAADAASGVRRSASRPFSSASSQLVPYPRRQVLHHLLAHPPDQRHAQTTTGRYSAGSYSLLRRTAKSRPHVSASYSSYRTRHAPSSSSSILQKASTFASRSSLTFDSRFAAAAARASARLASPLCSCGPPKLPYSSKAEEQTP